jgi:hypothetical protein
MSQYSAKQHSTQTTIKPIAFKRESTSYSKISVNQVDYIHGKNVRSANRAVKMNGAINLPERTY